MTWLQKKLDEFDDLYARKLNESAIDDLKCTYPPGKLFILEPTENVKQFIPSLLHDFAKEVRGEYFDPHNPLLDDYTRGYKQALKDFDKRVEELLQ